MNKKILAILLILVLSVFISAGISKKNQQPKLTPAPTAVNLDSDKDGLLDTQEALYGTDKNNPDTDGDGFKDGDEVKNGYNPLGEGKLIDNVNPKNMNTTPISMTKESSNKKDWFKEGAVYETHPYYYGANGKLSDITAAVPKIAELGVETIYLMPIFESIKTNKPCHDIYNILDYQKIDSRFGSEADLNKLVETVHASGMKIIFDMVTRLTPEGSVTYNNTDWMMSMSRSELEAFAQQKGWKLKYSQQDGNDLVYSGGLVCAPSLFLKCDLVGRVKGNDVIFLTWPVTKGYAPDNASEGRIKYITESAVYNVKKYNIDGWRIDTPFRNSNPEVFPGDHSVLNLFRSVTSEINKIKPDAFFMPEHPHVDSANTPAMDEMTQASYSQIFQKKLDAGIKTSKELVQIIESENITRDRTRMRYWETHDYERIASKEPNFTKAYAVLLSTIPGIPFIQAGQEIGATNTFCSGSAAKAAVNWTSGDYGLRDYYKKVLSIRNSSNVLKLGDIKDVWKSGDNVYAYSRTYENETAVAVINFNGKQAASILNIPFKNGVRLIDKISSETFTVSDPSNFKISVPAYGSRILMLK